MQGKIVVLELTDLGLTQQEMSTRSGVPQTTISCLKRGVRKSASYEKVVALQNLLKEVRAERAADGSAQLP